MASINSRDRHSSYSYSYSSLSNNNEISQPARCAVLNSAPALDPPTAAATSQRQLLHRRPQSSSTDTAYNGSEGHIDHISYSSSATATDPLFSTDSIVRRQSSSFNPARQPLSARLLSAVSNAQPAAAALSRKGSLLHSRAKSLAGAYVPKLNNASTGSPLSTSTTTTTSQNTPSRRENLPNKLLNDFFGGESVPIRFGPPISPSKEKDQTEFIMEYRPQLTERPFGGPRRRTTAESTRASTTGTSRTSNWFSRFSSVPSSNNTNSSPTREEAPDEFLTLDIPHALFPNGEADPLDPASFNDLLLTASTLLQRMQVAYREKSAFLTSIRPELDAQREESEEVETRSQHLKLQLEDLSRKSHDQEVTLKEMAEQLAEEKLKVQRLTDEAAAANAALAEQQQRQRQESQRTVRLVRRPSSLDSASSSSGSEASSQQQLQQQQDDDPTGRPRRAKRPSAASSITAAASDSGFESDADAASVFSLAMTNTSSVSSTAETSPSGYFICPSCSAVPTTTSPATANTAVLNSALSSEPEAMTQWALGQPPQKTRGKIQQRAPIPLRLGAATKNSADGAGAPPATPKRLGSEGAAWATVEVLRGENTELKRQVAGMRGELEECIRFVGGMGDL